MQNEDFVWHLVLGTLLSLFLGMGPAGQVCKGMTHTQTHRAPIASASHTHQSPQPSLASLGSHHLPLPTSCFPGGISQEAFTCPFVSQ